MNETELLEFRTLFENLTYEEILDLIDLKPDDQLKTDRLIRNTLISSLYALIVLVSFFGNLLVLFVCVKNLTKTNTLILSLSSSDLLMTLFNIPFNVVRLLREDWPFGKLLCLSVPFVQVMVVYVSSFTMAVIAFHRWRSVTSIMNSSSASLLPIIIIIVITWALSALMAIPTSLYNDVVEMFTYKKFVRCRVVYPDSKYNIPLILSSEIFLTQYLIPLSLSIYMYIKIGKVISRQGKIINLRGSIEAKRRQRHKRRRIIMLVLVVAVFAICWLPLNIYHLLVDTQVLRYNYKIFIVCHWFAMSSVCYNPFIYCWLNKTFRLGAKTILSYLVCGCTPTNPSASADNALEIDINRHTIEMNIQTENSPENDRNNVISL